MNKLILAISLIFCLTSCESSNRQQEINTAKSFVIISEVYRIGLIYSMYMRDGRNKKDWNDLNKRSKIAKEYADLIKSNINKILPKYIDELRKSRPDLFKGFEFDYSILDYNL